MIINIRGTSGSGKSTLVKRVTELYGLHIDNYIDGRKQPYYVTHRMFHLEAPPSLSVPGHYNTACGGCDTIKTVDEVYSIVRSCAMADPPHDILYEGIMVMDDVKRATSLHRDKPGQFLVIGLTTPVDECIAAVQSRRDARGEAKPLNPKNTVDRAKRCSRGLERLEANGVRVVRVDREGAFELVKRELGLT